MSRWILDASALLALLNAEPGWERVSDAVAEGATISTVNLSEVVARLADLGLSEGEVRAALGPIGVEEVDFNGEQSITAGLLRPRTPAYGLSLGDRACLALGIHERAQVLTADRRWAELALDPAPDLVYLR